MRSLREYLDPIKQKKQQKDSTGEGAPAKDQQRPASTSQALPGGVSLAPGLSTISELTSSVTQLDEESQLGAPPKVQRLLSEEGLPNLSVVVAPGTTTITTTTTATPAVASGVEVGGDVGGVEEGGGPTTATKGQDVVGGVWPNSTIELKGVPTTSHTTVPLLDQSSVLTTKRSEAAPTTTPVSRALTEPVSSAIQNQLGVSSQSNIAACDHQTVPSSSSSSSSSPPEEERKPVRTNSNESEKGQQGQATLAQPTEKQGMTSEGPLQSQKDTVVQPLPSSSAQPSSSHSLPVPVGPVEQCTTTRSDDIVATPTNPSTIAVLQSHEIGVIQSEHSAESTPTHFSQGSLESTSSSTISSLEQISSQESKGEREKSSADKLAGAAEKGTNGTLKKKGPRGKLKQIKLNFVEMTDEKVVKCALVTGTGQMVNFQFSMKYDKPVVMFQKLVSCLLDGCVHEWCSPNV